MADVKISALPAATTVAATDVAPIVAGGTVTQKATAAQIVKGGLPNQTGNAGKVLGTDGTNTSWVAAGGGSSLTGATQSATPFKTALGTGAGAAVTAGGTNNTMVGYNTGNLTTGGVNNTFMGSLAGRTTANGNSNTFMGYQAGELTTGSNNTFIGSGAGALATNISGATAVGNNCLGGASSVADGVTAIGFNALNVLSTGAGCTAIGYYAGEALQTGARNTIAGYQSLSTSVAGNDNTTLGYQAGRVATGNNNTLVGSGAGTAVTTAAGNTMVGKGAGSAVTTGANNTFVGGYAGTAAVANSIGLSDGAGVLRFFVNNNGALCFSNLFDYGAQGEVLKTYGSGGLPYWEPATVQTVLNTAAAISLTSQYAVYFANCATAGFTLTLPNAATNNGVTITVKRKDSETANVLTMASAGGLIEGVATTTIGVGMAVTYCSDGTDWWELANS